MKNRMLLIYRFNRLMKARLNYGLVTHVIVDPLYCTQVQTDRKLNAKYSAALRKIEDMITLKRDQW
jgi:hypothetical protein